MHADREGQRQLELAYLNTAHYACSMSVERLNAQHATLQTEQIKLNEQRKLNQIEMQITQANINHLSVFVQRMKRKN